MNDWLDDLLNDDLNDNFEDFFCPYTDGAECALLKKGWQVQELCEELDCEQLKRIQRSGGNSEAA
ncbi:MAG: hypothetical protein SNJ70_11525 [Armatimonadota bacterium]